MPPTEQMLPEVPRNGPATPQPAPSTMNGSGAFDPHQLLHALQIGDFSVRMAGDRTGIEGKIADTFNAIVSANQRMAQQLERVGELVGREGKARHRVRFGLSEGAWGEMESSVNTLIDDLIW